MFINILNLLFPSHCNICNKKMAQDIDPICLDCFKKIKAVPEPICQICGQPSFQTICYQCEKSKPLFTQARAAGIYEGVLKKSIHLFKYQNKRNLSRTLSDLLLRFLVKNLDWLVVDFLVPVPLNKLRLRERGYNQSEFLARELSRLLKIKLSSGNLRRKGISSPQVKSGRKERGKNVAGSFYLNKPKIFYNKKILLIDDVFTTGSTANACAQILKEAEVREILVLAVACTCK